MTRYRRTSHAIWLALSEGFIVTTLVLAETSGGRGAGLITGPLREPRSRMCRLPP
ncbi:hypothetical protein PV409_31745 [Streptomyces sp. ME02-6979.5a]|uniref:hypothetical protein n=1 Tax=Streptomyces sp. ME02-6979.5a TaxID=462925 RepID=UPI0029A064B7|nr:hypothetical protein [Streptomyces sp. ME02-6979.5a]MDX3342541.1 hypothetical protein [Streptomyces sp. ME02-6979.5a]